MWGKTDVGGERCSHHLAKPPALYVQTTLDKGLTILVFEVTVDGRRKVLGLPKSSPQTKSKLNVLEMDGMLAQTLRRTLIV